MLVVLVDRLYPLSIEMFIADLMKGMKYGASSKRCHVFDHL